MSVRPGPKSAGNLKDSCIGPVRAFRPPASKCGGGEGGFEPTVRFLPVQRFSSSKILVLPVLLCSQACHLIGPFFDPTVLMMACCYLTRSTVRIESSAVTLKDSPKTGPQGS